MMYKAPKKIFGIFSSFGNIYKRWFTIMIMPEASEGSEGGRKGGEI